MTYELHSVWKMDRTTGRTPFRVNSDLCALCLGENKNDKLVSPVNSTGRDSRSPGGGGVL